MVFSGNPAHVEGVEEVIAFFYPSILTAEQPLVFKGEGDAPVDLRVYDVCGRLVQQERVQSGQFLNLHSCMPGMYVFSWGDRTQKPFVIKFTHTLHIASKWVCDRHKRESPAPNGPRVAVRNGHFCTTLRLSKPEHSTLLYEHISIPAARRLAKIERGSPE